METVVGTALEAHSRGAGSIQVFVHRGWYGGEGRQLVGPQPAATSSNGAKDREIELLRHRLAVLEARLDRLTVTDLAASALR